MFTKPNRLHLSREVLSDLTSLSLKEIVQIDKDIISSISKHLQVETIESKDIESTFILLDKIFCIYCSLKHENKLKFQTELNETQVNINNKAYSIREAIALSNVSFYCLFNNTVGIHKMLILYIVNIRPALINLVELNYDSALT